MGTEFIWKLKIAIGVCFILISIYLQFTPCQAAQDSTTSRPDVDNMGPLHSMFFNKRYQANLAMLLNRIVGGKPTNA